jgi:PAS domain S-box-containing protein
MSSKPQTKAHITYLEERIQYLEEVNRFTLDILEMAASLGDFQPSINKLQEPSVILEETRSRVQRLIPFQTLAFYLIDDADNSFALASCRPKRDKSLLQNEVDFLIDNGTFAWTLRERRAVIVSTKNYKRQLLLHAMATSSRVRGMFVGLMEKDTSNIPDTALSLLSIILLNSSNALESFELYKMIREISKSLEKKENYRTLFEAAPDGVEVLDVRGNIVDCNKTYQALLKRNKDKIVGNHTTEFFSPDTKGFFEQKFQVLKDTGYVEGEVELVSSEGSAIPVWRKEKAIYNGNREFVGSVIYNRDISSLKQAEEQKRNLEARLQQAKKMEAIGTLAGGIAHAFNNLLMGIQGHISLLLLDIDSKHPHYSALKKIEKAIQGGAELTSQLIGYARKGRYRSKSIAINEIVENTSQTFQKMKKEITIHCELTQRPHAIEADQGQMEQMLLNLFINAADAMPGGGDIHIKTKNVTHRDIKSGLYEAQPGKYVRVTVSDRGAGIDKEIQHRIFDPFFTTKRTGKGTGLGLASVYGIVKSHEGYINAESKKGRGTTFLIYLPAADKRKKKK